MKQPMKRRFIFMCIVLCTAAAHPLTAQDRAGWYARGSILVFPENNGNASAPTPILPAIGGGIIYPINDLLAVEASLDIYGTTYDYDYRLERPVPANDEFRSAFVTGILFGLQPVFRWRPAGEKYTIRAYGGPAFDFRIIFGAYGIADDEQHTNDRNPNTMHTVAETRQEISSYFWGGGRFFFPFIGGGMDFPIMEGSQLGVDLRAWFPAWRLWSGESLPGIEGFRFGAGFRINF
jgi:hypothetical protein